MSWALLLAHPGRGTVNPLLSAVGAMASKLWESCLYTCLPDRERTLRTGVTVLTTAALALLTC
ncbi:hypothetical protein HJC10_37540 [Corallococcus exiguus]|uniref:hypothetical protein n=1 Tax=Corallococcus TaxID=83461 RepID=UPI000EBAA743|nr:MULTISPECIES: hypothetical protein [Corallococcus]NNB99893.1 hypothetical protein [Corallococcus exiguus]NNC08529.1 hypothetical protein [Corallococcus exiguus]NPC52077.1 hypothetical protein [Corallococcus exiguus]RKH99105.1 hypothetical protein D7Y15_39085 [Corallococcus sp. AB030]